MDTKSIFLDPSKCNGCGDCETACAVKRTGIKDPNLSCIRIVQNPSYDEFYLPVLCMQCTEPACMEACPREAIHFEESSNRILIDYSRCVGCRMCYASCPFGAISFDNLRGRVFKCDLCGGEPECIKSCEPGALTFTEDVQPLRAAAYAEKMVRAFQG